ncbi:hypothetical protein T439DRAFT_54798 [Meredithblackwellia eburnea MCA 4105]
MGGALLSNSEPALHHSASALILQLPPPPRLHPHFHSHYHYLLPLQPFPIPPPIPSQPRRSQTPPPPLPHHLRRVPSTSEQQPEFSILPSGEGEPRWRWQVQCGVRVVENAQPGMSVREIGGSRARSCSSLILFSFLLMSFTLSSTHPLPRPRFSTSRSVATTNNAVERTSGWRISLICGRSVLSPSLKELVEG